LPDSFRQAVVTKTGGVAAGGAFEDADAAALPPDFKLLDGGGAEGVAGNKRDLFAAGLEFGCQFADGGGFAGAVDPDHQNNERFLGIVNCQRLFTRLENCFDVGGKFVFDFRVAGVFVQTAFGKAACDFGAGSDANVRADQKFFKFVKRLGVDAALGKDAADAAGKLGGRLFEAKA